MTHKFKSLLQLLDYFKDEQFCKEYLIYQRWKNKPECPHCGCDKCYTTNRGFKCANKECHKKFTVITGTIFENTKIKLHLWFAAMYLITAHKKSISSLQLSCDLNITQKTAWFMSHRIREILKETAPEMLSGTIEVDETYIGGKIKNRHVKKKVTNSQGRSAKDKIPVIGVLERDGKVITQVVTDTEARTLQPIIATNVEKGSRVISDSYLSYKGLDAIYNHVVIKHVEGNYVTSEDKHTNNIEGFWSQLKRGVVGIYYFVSAKHLHRYCDEFSYRFDTRKDKDTFRFEDAVTKVANARLRYKTLIMKAA